MRIITAWASIFQKRNLEVSMKLTSLPGNGGWPVVVAESFSSGHHRRRAGRANARRRGPAVGRVSRDRACRPEANPSGPSAARRAPGTSARWLWRSLCHPTAWSAATPDRAVRRAPRRVDATQPRRPVHWRRLDSGTPPHGGRQCPPPSRCRSAEPSGVVAVVGSGEPECRDLWLTRLPGDIFDATAPGSLR